MATTSKVKKVHCNKCRRKTDHRLIKTFKGDSGSEQYGEDYAIWWDTTYDVFQCCGCGEALLVRTWIFSEHEDAEVRYFPPRVSRHSPEWKDKLPPELMLVLDEVYRALDGNNRRLPMMGARTLVDMVIREKVGDLGSLVAGLKELEKQGFISSKNREVLEAAFDVGRAAAHRGYFPKSEVVNLVMDIVENMLQAVYVLHDAAQKLKKSTPPRPARKSKP
jgi:hypothetical protein